MQVNVQVYGKQVVYGHLNQRTTVGQLMSYVAKQMGLCETNYFGLQAVVGTRHSPVWTNPKQTVASLIQLGLHFAEGFALRVLRFPPDLTQLKHDPVALELFYLHVSDGLQREICFDFATEIFLLVLRLQIEYGNMRQVHENCGCEQMAQALKPFFKCFKVEPQVTYQMVLKLWLLFENLARNDAILNYLAIVQNSPNYHHETIWFTMRKKNVTTDCQLGINFDGLRVYNEAQELFNWSSIKSISCKQRSITIQLLDDDLSRVKFQTYSNKAALYLFEQVVHYHKTHLTMVSRSANKCPLPFQLTYHQQFCQNVIQNLFEDLNHLCKNQCSQTSVKSIQPSLPQTNSSDQPNALAQSVRVVAQVCHKLTEICTQTTHNLNQMSQTLQVMQSQSMVARQMGQPVDQNSQERQLASKPRMVDSQIQTREESEEGTIGESEGQSIDNAELIVSSPLNGDTSWTREMVNVANATPAPTMVDCSEGTETEAGKHPAAPILSTTMSVTQAARAHNNHQRRRAGRLSKMKIDLFESLVL